MVGNGSVVPGDDTAEALNRYAGIVSHTPDPISLISTDFKYLMVNEAFCLAHGKDHDEIVGTSMADLWGRDLFNRKLKKALACCFDGETMHFSGEFPFGILGERFFSVTYYPYYGTGGHISGAVVSSRDITEFKRVAVAQEESERRYRALFHSSADALLVFDADGSVLEANKVARQTFGYSDEELRGLPITRLFTDSDAHQIAAAAKAELGYSGRAAESVAHRRGGTRFPVDIRLSSVPYQDRAVCLATVRDITESKRTQDEIAHLANYDMVTGLPNRRHFFDHLHAAVARAKRNDSWLALLYLDLDHFKPVNDQFGHHVGDELLAEVANRIDATLREIDVAGRIGGDEFAVLLESVHSIGDTITVVRKLLTALSAGYRVSKNNLDISASIGVAMYPQHCTDPVKLVSRADHAMYHAKRERNAFFIWSPHLSQSAATVATE